jgi:hypothetical protein
MTRFNLNIPHTLMRSESAKARLSDDFVPVHHDVDSHCREGSVPALKNEALKVVVLAVHERGEIRACESVKVGRRDLRNPVAPEDCMIEKQTAL